jgi:hypothetical protein
LNGLIGAVHYLFDVLMTCAGSAAGLEMAVPGKAFHEVKACRRPIGYFTVP